MIRFIVAIAATAAMLYVATLWLAAKGSIVESNWQLKSLVFLAIINLLTFAYLTRLAGDPQRFTLFYLGSIVVKILAGCAFVIIMIRADRGNAQVNASLFLIAYLIFTGIEVVLLFLKVNRSPK